MTTQTIKVLDADSVERTIPIANLNGQAVMDNSSPVVIASNQTAIPVAVEFPETQPVSLDAPVAIDNATLATLQGFFTTLAGLLETIQVGNLPADPATGTAQAAELAAINKVGTRAYSTGIARLAVGATDAASTAIAASEVLLHASVKMYVRENAAATTKEIPLEAGEKFHMRITNGNTIHAIRDSVDGFLNIIPVA